MMVCTNISMIHSRMKMLCLLALMILLVVAVGYGYQCGQDTICSKAPQCQTVKIFAADVTVCKSADGINADISVNPYYSGYPTMYYCASASGDIRCGRCVDVQVNNDFISWGYQNTITLDNGSTIMVK